MAQIPAGMWQQNHFTMAKHAHRASNLANEDVDLVGAFDQNMEQFLWESNGCDFRICM